MIVLNLLSSSLQEKQKPSNGSAASDPKEVVEGAVQAALTLAAEVTLHPLQSLQTLLRHGMLEQHRAFTRISPS